MTKYVTESQTDDELSNICPQNLLVQKSEGTGMVAVPQIIPEKKL
jgi:hypothetical protein